MRDWNTPLLYSSWSGLEVCSFPMRDWNISLGQDRDGRKTLFVASLWGIETIPILPPLFPLARVCSFPMRDEGCVSILLFFLPFPFLFGLSPFSWSVFKIRLWNKGERERLLRKRAYHLAVTPFGWKARLLHQTKKRGSQWHPLTCLCEERSDEAVSWFGVFTRP